MPKIFDCFVFNDELELLELRLETSAPIVDTFVLVEATRTFSGAEKRLHYALNESRFSPWRDKLRHVVVDDMPLDTGRRWDAEVHQRNALLRGLKDAGDDDVVVVSDADEIVHPEVLMTLRSCRDLVGLEMPRAFHFANWNVPSSRFAVAARAMPYGRLEDPHRQRNHVSPDRVIRNAGHHFTSLGSVAALVRKFETYSHAEMDNEQQKAGAYLERAHAMGLDVFSRRLVSVTRPDELSGLQLALLRRNPELFDFSELPDEKRRQRFQRYAAWRARQDACSDLVRELDQRYDVRPWRVRVVVAQEMLRHAFWTFPRGLARTVRNRLRELSSASPVPAQEGS